MRMSYARQKEVLDMPNLIEIQKDSYQWFLDDGLMEVFNDIFRNLYFHFLFPRNLSCLIPLVLV